MMNRLFKLILLSLLIIGLNGCGVYTFNPKGKSSLKSIAILPLENQTDRFELTDRLTEIIVDQFITDGNLTVMSETTADAILTGVLLRYERVEVVFDETDQVQQYKVLMDFMITLTDRNEAKELWSTRMNQEGIFDAVSETEEDGQLRAGERLVEQIINRTTKSW